MEIDVINVTLRASLSEWCDADVTLFELAKCVGMLDVDAELRKYKSTFWSSNVIGETLYEILTRLVSIGVLEYDKQEDQYRWNPNFRVTPDHIL